MKLMAVSTLSLAASAIACQCSMKFDITSKVQRNKNKLIYSNI
jgi:hypothetical protein